MGKKAVQTFSCLLAGALLVATLAPPAEARSFFTPRRTFGVLFLGGSLLMAKKALDFHQDANKLYDAYKAATTPDEAQTLYQKTSDRDTKSQMSLGVSLLLLVGGLRLFLDSGVDDNVPKLDRRLTVDVSGDARTHTVQFAVKRHF